MSDSVSSTRRGLRVPARCTVRAATSLSSWDAETEDIGPLGCRLVGPRPLERGQPLKLAITSPHVQELLEAVGRVAWRSVRPPWRVGVAFAEAHLRDGQRWFDELVAAQPELLLHDHLPDQLPEGTMLYLAAPPPGPFQVNEAEAEVLRRIGEGTTVRELRLRLAEGWERFQHALFSLLSRSALTLARGEAAAPEPWLAILGRPLDRR
jgi:hypothetical protein